MDTKKKVSKWTILIIVIMSTFMSALDGSIVNVALPDMAGSLHVTTSGIQFVATSYLIVIAGIILVFGRLGDIFSKTRMFTLGLAIFSTGSFLCGISHSYEFLILARIIQAVGAAATMGNNQGILTEVFPQNERGKALGILGTAVALGALAGPGLGGLIVGASSWQYIFLINVPVGIVALIGAIRYLPRPNQKPQGTLDFLGAVLFMLSIVPLFLSLDEGIDRGFSDPVILLGFLISAVSFFFFLIVEKRKDMPLLQLEMFGNKLFSLSIFCGFISFVAIFCNNIILPFYLQDFRGFSPAYAGLIMMIYPIILTAVSPASGHLSDRIGSEMLTFIGLLLIAGGLFSMAALRGNSGLAGIVFSIALMGFGTGMFQPPNNSLVMSVVPKNKLGIAGSINALVRNLGMVCGMALGSAILYSLMSLKIGERVVDYVPNQSGAFLFGMRGAYIVAGSVSLIGVVFTFLRISAGKRESMIKEAQEYKLGE